MIDRIKEVFTKEFWSLKNVTASPRKRYLFKQIRIFSIAIKGFSEDRVQVRASALTYYTMLSIVPIFAMAFGIAKGFNIDALLTKYIQETFASQEAVATYIQEFAETYLLNIKGGVIAGVGVFVLIWTVIRLLSNIELSFNDIWQIKKSRVMSRKLSDYISLVVIAPVLMVASFSLTGFIGSKLMDNFYFLGPIPGLIISLIPIIMVWLVLTLVYIIMPNTKVNFSSAFAGGLVAGTIFHLFQFLYLKLQGNIFKYDDVYGVFAALPLFLIWMQLSWLIVLFGAEIAFANQNVEHYESESESFNISHHMKRVVSLTITKLISENFRDGISPMTSEDIANKFDLSVRLVRDIIFELLEVGIVSETVTQNVKENAYQPAMDINKLTIGYVLDLLDKRGKDNIETESLKYLNVMIALVDGFGKEIEKSPNNKLLLEI